MNGTIRRMSKRAGIVIPVVGARDAAVARIDARKRRLEVVAITGVVYGVEGGYSISYVGKQRSPAKNGQLVKRTVYVRDYTQV
jgi:hypothetical protein